MTCGVYPDPPTMEAPLAARPPAADTPSASPGRSDAPVLPSTSFHRSSQDALVAVAAAKDADQLSHKVPPTSL